MGVFQSNVFQNNVFQGPHGTVIDTVTHSQHPVNCVMVQDMVGVKRRITEWSHFGKQMKEKVTVTTGGAQRLSKAPASFTSITKRADRFN